MSAAATYYVCAVLVDNGERGELLRCDSATSPLELHPLLTAYAAAFTDRPDVLVDVSVTPAA